MPTVPARIDCIEVHAGLDSGAEVSISSAIFKAICNDRLARGCDKPPRDTNVLRSGVFGVSQRVQLLGGAGRQVAGDFAKTSQFRTGTSQIARKYECLSSSPHVARTAQSSVTTPLS